MAEDCIVILSDVDEADDREVEHGAVFTPTKWQTLPSDSGRYYMIFIVMAAAPHLMVRVYSDEDSEKEIGSEIDHVRYRKR